MKKLYFGLITTSILVLIIVLSFILYNEWPLMTGQKIVLSTQPVDPIDPFRGQYMTINYEISRISDVEGFKKDDKIYVLLKEDEQSIWRLDGTSDIKPLRGTFIKGKVTSVYGNQIRVHYGIEQFFFERRAELPTRNITVEVSIAKSGRAMLSQMLYNGEPIEIEYEEFNIKA